MSTPSIGDELRAVRLFCLDFAPSHVCRPAARQRLDRRGLYALRCIRDPFPFGPFCRVDAPAQFSEFRFRNIHMKRANGSLVGGEFGTSFCSSGWAIVFCSFIVTRTSDLLSKPGVHAVHP